MCIDDNTSKGEAFDVARILVNIPLSLCILDYVPVCIDGVIYNLCIREDAHNLHRHVEGNQKFQSSDGDTSDSDSERLMVESDSGCSDEIEGMESMEAHNSGDLIKKDEALLVDHCLRHSGVIPESGTRGKLVAFSGVDTKGNCKLFVGSVSRSVSDAIRAEDEIISKVHAEPEVGNVNLLAIRSRDVTSCKGKSDLKSDNESASSGKCVLVCSDDSSKPVVNSKSGNPLSLIPVDGKARCLRNSDKVFRKEDSSRLGPDGSNPNVWSMDFINSDGSSKDGSSEAGGSEVNTSKSSKRPLHSGQIPDSEEATDRGSNNDSISVSLTTGGHPKAFLAKDFGAVGIISTSSIGGSVNCTNGDSGSVCEGTVVLNFKAVNDSYCKQGDDIPIGDRGGRKIIRKVILKCDQNLVGKSSLKAKSKVGRSSKGDITTVYHRGSTSTCYGEQSEESDIQRNNGRQWDILKREVRERLWEAMAALGVVECEGRNALLLGRESAMGGRKEKKNLCNDYRFF